jgi:6-phosphogluconate dehydrogenase
MNKSSIGIIGLSTMGANLARNFGSKGFLTSVFNRSYDKTKKLVELWSLDKSQNSYSGEIIGFENLKDFVQSLERPRKILLLVKSGQPVDDFIEKLYPYLDDDDVIVDTGNSNWLDTQRRQDILENGKLYTLAEVTAGKKSGEIKKIHFIGSGVSGGEEGALKGPSIMPGGNADSVESLLPILEKISADDFNGGKCVTNIGLGASGHFVKMVHNGIEYAIMQGIAEIYDILRSNKYNNDEIKEIFTNLNQDSLKGFLLDITEQIFKTETEDGNHLVDKIKDEAKAKGTGAWTVEAALKFGVFAPTISASVFARVGSARNQNYKLLRNLEFTNNNKVNLELLQKSLEAVYLVSYLQGFDIIDHANKEKDWKIDMQEVIRIWQGGCIIRSKMLIDLPKIWESEVDFKAYIPSLESIQTAGSSPKPVLNSTLDYILTIQAYKLPTNLIQAQRDLFGAHTFNRTDKDGTFSGGWAK